VGRREGTYTESYVISSGDIFLLVAPNSVESRYESRRVVDRVPVLKDLVASPSVFRVMSLSCARTSSHKPYKCALPSL